ncbi:RNA processing exonuclease, beta-lactamase fold, Cft2 family [Paenibacillus sp. 1_12]|uniref:MBL fold metallo-hydrolase n=1 Tax=Paenibacillus sp. 1_12 TaxID=1566278 RepID=UPI0008E50F00|nr:MBL fold metallo-hydrolase [Paenibacillus sp. 1_12]SFL68009.1 RNA processing exonuclease, beta-lactamase fold, Cft2 family [Paenibacillus sp. 1_12]
MQATVWGGAGEHGRSCYLIEQGRTRVLLDCGVKKEGSGEYPLFEENVVPQLDAVFLSHAHEDHSIAIPLLYTMGYAGIVWTTRATSEQLPSYYQAWERFAASTQAELPYRDTDISAIRFKFIEEHTPSGVWYAIQPGLSVCWGRSGHLAGSIWLLLNVEGRLVFYSGDYTAESTLLAADRPQPELLENPIDFAIIDAAYGIDPDSQQQKLEQLRLQMEETLQQGGPVLLPVPTYGRGQEMLLWAREQFPDIPIFVEQEITVGLKQLLQGPEWLQLDAIERIQACLIDPRIVFVDSEEKRLQAVSAIGSRIVLTNDGMLQSARGQWYYEKLVEDNACCVILTGHLAKGSCGHRLLMASREQMEILDHDAGQVHFIRFKVHQGLPDVRAMLDVLASKHTILVHAGQQSTDALCAQLAKEGYANLHVLTAGGIWRE